MWSSFSVRTSLLVNRRLSQGKQVTYSRQNKLWYNKRPHSTTFTSVLQSRRCCCAGGNNSTLSILEVISHCATKATHNTEGKPLKAPLTLLRTQLSHSNPQSKPFTQQSSRMLPRAHTRGHFKHRNTKLLFSWKDRTTNFLFSWKDSTTQSLFHGNTYELWERTANDEQNVRRYHRWFSDHSLLRRANHGWTPVDCRHSTNRLNTISVQYRSTRPTRHVVPLIGPRTGNASCW